MSTQTRIPEGVPTGGQFAAAARREAVVALHESPLMAQATAAGRGEPLEARKTLVAEVAGAAQSQAETRGDALRARLSSLTSTRSLQERLAQTREDMTEERAQTLRARIVSSNTSGLADRLAAASRARQDSAGLTPRTNDLTVVRHAS